VKLQRYLTQLIGLGILPLLLLVSWFAVQQVREMRRDDHHAATTLATTLAVSIDASLRARVAGLQVLALSQLAHDSDRRNEFRREAEGYKAGFGDDVMLVDTGGHMLLHTHLSRGASLPPLALPPGRSALREAATTGAPAVGDLFAGPVVPEPTFAIAVPARRGEEPALMIVAIVPIRQIADELQRFELPTGWFATVRDSRGGLIAQRSSTTSDATAADQADWRFIEHTTAAPWSVEVRIPRALYLQRMSITAALLALTVVAVTLLVAAGGWLASRKLTRAVQALAAPDASEAQRSATNGVAAIDEIRAVRRVLTESSARRTEAEQLRRAEDEQHRVQLERIARDLRLREAQLRSIFDSASEAIITIDESLRIVMANRAAATEFRRPLDEMIGLPIDQLLPERFRAGHGERVLAFGQGEDGTRSSHERPELRGLRADGDEFPIEAAISHFAIDARQFFTVILRDVTERRAAEGALLASKAKLESALESMSDAVCIADAGGRCVEFNRAFVAFHRYASREQCPITAAECAEVLELSARDGSPVPLESWPIPRALRGEEASSIEFSARRRDSGETWVGSYSFAPIRGPGGEINGAVVSARDITEQTRLLAELQNSQTELRELVAAQQQVEERERKRIARELHDEMQQVLAAIKMDVAGVESALDDDESRRVRSLLARIDELAGAAITSSRRIVSDLQPLLLEELGLEAALRALCSRFAERTGLAVTFNSQLAGHASHPPAMAVCLYRVTQESLNNVLRHAQARRVQVALAAQGDTLVATIEDDGRGLNAEDRRKPLSTGLRGMSERVRALGGSFSARGGPDQGTTIEVRLSTATAARSTSADPGQAGADVQR
jgi:PAS domain S-box-containing protein